jgi:hypothetical protein
MNGHIDERGRHVVGQLMPTEELKRNKLARKYSRHTFFHLNLFKGKLY